MVVVFQGEKTSHVKIGYSKLFKNLRGRVSKTFKIHQKYCVGLMFEIVNNPYSVGK